MATNQELAPNVRFFTHVDQNPTKSREKGRPIYDEMEAVEISFGGDRLMKRVFPAHSFARYFTTPDGQTEEQTYAMRFSEHYKRFKSGKEQAQDGTPLEELTFLTKGKRMELKALGIHTAENLAALDGQPLKSLGMGGREMKNQAQAYLDSASGSAVATKLAAENEDLKARIKMLEEEQLAPTPQLEPAVPPSEFEDWDDALLKDYIEEKTGAKPKGNPSHATLVAAAEELKAG